MIITKQEKELAKTIFTVGLNKAAEALSFFVKEKVFVINTHVSQKTSPGSEIFDSKKVGQELVVLETAVKGALKGQCYLIFSKREAEALTEVAVPSIKDKPAEVRIEFQDAFLRELDNIVSAAVILQLSNFFTYDMHGDVPHSYAMNQAALPDFLCEKTDEQQFSMHFKSEFRTENIVLEPEFVWSMDHKYLEGIRANAF
jgi:chemotaxis protein CheY-P-specific phosphatase CheC